MSKNFELMQQTIAQPRIGLRSRTDVASLRAHESAPGNGRHQDLDELARAECMKLLQRIFLTGAGNRNHVVVFAGIDRGNGCSRTCFHVAESLASNTSGSVCVVDANLRSPSLPEYFGVTNHRGLTDALLQPGAIRGFAKQLRSDNLWFLSGGALVEDPASLLSSNQLKERLDELKQEFDYVLIDSPPLGLYADAIALGRLTDGLILVLEANSTRRESALKIRDGLRTSNVAVLGAILNKRTYPIPDSLYHRF